jgi:hypothetical protein
MRRRLDDLERPSPQILFGAVDVKDLPGNLSSLIHFSPIWYHGWHDTASEGATITIIHDQNDEKIDDRVIQIFVRSLLHGPARTHGRTSKTRPINFASFSNLA